LKEKSAVVPSIYNRPFDYQIEGNTPSNILFLGVLASLIVKLNYLWRMLFDN